METYSEVINYLYSRLPVFQRIGSAAYKPGLGNITALCGLLDDPQNKFPVIHTAGTNGKGSVSHYLASILQSAGYKNVGLHTSPHLKDFRERIRINGKLIDEQSIIDFVNRYKDSWEKMDPSFFEISVAMAFYFFAEAHSQVTVIETGLGGRLDSTNIVDPVLSVITNISFDHMAFLGNTLEKIAFEKAGIIKPNRPVVIGETHTETKPVFLKKAHECNAPILFADDVYKAVNPNTVQKNGKPYMVVDILKNGKPYLEKLYSELNGNYQLKNIPTVLASVDVLNTLSYNISEEHIRDGIANVSSQTGLWGRWQILSDKPKVIADTGHNEAGIKEVLAQLTTMQFDKLHFVFGVVNDKDVSSVLKLLPKNAQYYFCKANIPRALDEKELAKQSAGFGLKGESYATVAEALNAAKAKAASNDLIFIGGSTFVVAEAI
jgi:dihydrofolate synthase/folylpolyglutamate synthase